LVAPTLDPVVWDLDPEGHVRFTCKTHWVPLKSQAFKVTLQADGAKLKDVVFAEKGGLVGDDGSLVFFPNAADAENCKTRLESGKDIDVHVEASGGCVEGAADMKIAPRDDRLRGH